MSNSVGEYPDKSAFFQSPYDPLEGASLPTGLPGINEAPYSCVRLNSQWVPIITGAIARLLYSDVWDADADASFPEYNSLLQLLAQLSGPGLCNDTIVVESPMQIGDIKATFSSACGPGWAALDGGTIDGVVYPDFLAWAQSNMPGWVSGSIVQLPDLDGRFLIQESPRGSTGGSNQITLTANQLPPHTHNIINASAQARIPTTNATTLGGFVADNANGQPGRTFVNRLATSSQGGVTGQAIDITPSAIAVGYCILIDMVQVVVPVQSGPQGPVGPQGIPGNQGPVGPQGDCDCTDDVNPPPQQPLVLPSQVDERANICAAAARIVDGILEIILSAMDVVDAILDSGGFLTENVVPQIQPLLNKIRGTGWGQVFTWVEGLQGVVTALIRTEINSSTFREDFTLAVYCCLLKYRQWDERATDCIRDGVPSGAAQFTIQSSIGTGAISPDLIGDAYSRGVVEESNLCLAFSDCPDCVGVGLNEDFILNPDIVFEPSPMLTSAGGVPIAVWDWTQVSAVRVQFLSGARCVDRLDFWCSRPAVNNDPIFLDVEIGDKTFSGSVGGSGNGDFEVNTSGSTDVNTIIIRPGAGNVYTSLRIIYDTAARPDIIDIVPI